MTYDDYILCLPLTSFGMTFLNSSHSASLPTLPAKNSTVSQRFFGLSAEVAQHCLALFSLASLEALELFKKTVSSLIFLVAIITALLIAYVSLLATMGVIAVTQLHSSWVTVLGMISLTHLVIAALLVTLLRWQSSSSLPFEKTTLEIQNDLEALASTSLSDAHNL